MTFSCFGAWTVSKDFHNSHFGILDSDFATKSCIKKTKAQDLAPIVFLVSRITRPGKKKCITILNIVFIITFGTNSRSFFPTS